VQRPSLTPDKLNPYIFASVPVWDTDRVPSFFYWQLKLGVAQLIYLTNQTV
jgi:hypothetical protein